jgi:uncharacterized protein (TIGR02118 family)
MIRVVAFYRWVEGAAFDHEYYRLEHMRITKELLTSRGLIRLESDRYLTNTSPVAGTVIAATHAYFPSMEVARNAVAETSSALLEDVPNYTSLKPELCFAAVSAHD